MNADGSNQIRLTNSPGRDNHPRWSADGSQIVWESDRDGPPNINPKIFEMDAVDADGDGNGDNLVRLIDDPSVDASPDLSPDGKIVFSSNRDHEDGEIYVADGSGVSRLTNNLAIDGAPMWSPDGTKIVFHSGRDGNVEIYVMDANGTNQTRLTNNPAQDAAPEWSPDGTKIVFESQREGTSGASDICVMDAIDADDDGNGDNLIQLTNDPADDQNPSWGPG